MFDPTVHHWVILAALWLGIGGMLWSDSNANTRQPALSLVGALCWPIWGPVLFVCLVIAWWHGRPHHGR